MKEQFDLRDDKPNTYGRTEITCPHCGYEQGYSWENRNDTGIETCCSCGKIYEWTRDVTVKYQSEPITP